MAEALYNQALSLMEKGNNEQACPLLKQSHEIDPAVGTLLYLGLCYERVGRTASAWATYRAAAEAGRKANQAERSKMALQRANDLEDRLTHITLLVPKDVEDVTVHLDGVPLRSAALGLPMPVDPGVHQIEASAPGRRRVEMTIEVKSDEPDRTVNVTGLLPLADAAVSETETAASTESSSAQPTPDADTSSVPRLGKGLGVVVGADIDGKFRGAVANIGASYVATEWLELSASALVGRDRGAQPAASFYLLSGVVMPSITLALPVFLTDGVRPGGQVAAGLRLNPTPGLGFYARGGVTAFASVPDGYDETVPVVSAGVAGSMP